MAAIRARNGLRSLVAPTLWLSAVVGLVYLYLLSSSHPVAAAGNADSVCLFDQILNVIGPTLEFDGFRG